LSQFTHKFYSVKKKTNLRATLVIFKETAQGKKMPKKRRKFAQSGHPATYVDPGRIKETTQNTKTQ
jgi:hypothetical protein